MQHTHDTTKAIAAYQELRRSIRTTPKRSLRWRSCTRKPTITTEAKNVPGQSAGRRSQICCCTAGQRARGYQGERSAGSAQPLNNALSLAIQFDNQEQKGAILQALGIAYQDMNKPDDALRNFQQALEIRRKDWGPAWHCHESGAACPSAGRLGDAKAALVATRKP